MSERSSPRELLLLVALAACSKRSDDAAVAAKKPTADPAAVLKIMSAITARDPAPGAGRECKPIDYANALTLTYPSVFKLSGAVVAGRESFENADWINPYDLDHPSIRTLLDKSADATARGEAAAEFLASTNGYVVYRIDLIDVGLALAFKDLKRGIVAARAIKYDKTGQLVCTHNYTFKNTKKVSEWAMDEAEKSAAAVSQVVVDKLREDLRVRYLRAIIKLGMPLPPQPAPQPATDEE